MTKHIATFAAGCFWCVEEEFRRMDGVSDTMVGYTGGRTKDPTYKQVCSKTSGHAEAVHVEFDPKKVSYEELLDVFFTIHDPTQVDRQGPDVGDQYRSAIFYHDEAQKKSAQNAIEKWQHSGRFDKPIATRLEPISAFYKAEDYHQQYYEKMRAR